MTMDSLMTCDKVSNSWFDELYHHEGEFTRLLNQDSFSPSSETFVKDSTFHLRVELKGIELKDVNVSLEDGCLTVTGKRENRYSRNDDSYHMEKFSCRNVFKNLQSAAVVLTRKRNQCVF